MITGVLCTLTVKLPGTLIILSGTFLYGMYTGFITFSTPIIILLIGIAGLTELGGLLARKQLTKNYPVSPVFSVNSIVGHVAGILVSAALFKPAAGFVLWELFAGKTLLPRGDSIVQVLVRLAGVAVVRLLSGIAMMVLIHMYIFL